MGISQELLKLIACLTMLIDHIGYVFFPANNILRVIGRISFPLYCFLLCQGLLHTKKPLRYFLRFLAVMVISEIPFDLLFFGGITLAHQNVMFTLLLGLLMGLCIRRIPQLPLKMLCVVPFAFAAELLQADYGGYGIFIIALFLFSQHTAHPRLTELLGLFLFAICQYDVQITILGIDLPFQLFAMLSMVPICLYNGKKVTASPFVKWGFYLFYPLHLVVLLLIKSLISANC